MNEEMEFGPYLASVRRYWYLPVAGLIGALVLAAVIIVVQGNPYTATATVAVPAPRYLWRLASGIQNASDTARKDPRDDVLPMLRTEAAAAQVVAQLAAPDASGAAQAGADRAVTASEALSAAKFAKSGTALIAVKASADEPELAAALANAWADAVVSVANEASQAAANAAGVQAELDATARQLAEADQAYEQLRAETGLELRMGGALAADNNRLYAADALSKNELILQDATLAEYKQALAYVRMLIKKGEAVQAAGGTPDSLPLELLRTGLLEARGNVTVDALRAVPWDTVLSRLRAEELALAETESALGEEVRKFQEELARQNTEVVNLERERAILADIVGQLRRKAEEIRIQQQLDAMEIRVMSRAGSPARADWMDKLVVVLVAGLLGLGVGLLAALVRGALRTPAPSGSQGPASPATLQGPPAQAGRATR